VYRIFSKTYLNNEVVEEFPPVNTGCNLAPGIVSRLEVSLPLKTCLSQNQQRFLGAPVKWPRPNMLSAWLDVTPGFESTSYPLLILIRVLLSIEPT
jgi:hypothetical protein